MVEEKDSKNVINLETIASDFGLEGYWWNLIRSINFGYLGRIPNHKEFSIENDDIIIHKHIEEEEGRRFPVVRYFRYVEGQLLELKKSDIDEVLQSHFIEIISQDKKIPYKCELKYQKNGTASVKFAPTEYDTFSFKVYPKDFKTEDSLENVLGKLPMETKNILDPTADQEITIQPIQQSAVLQQVASESGSDTVCIFDAKILEINKRTSQFQEHITSFYILRVKGGQAASDTKKSTLKRDFEEINVKCSENAMGETKLNVGDSITFKGKLVKDKKGGVIIQNIRKFEKSANSK